MQCPRCERYNPPDARFCNGCGQPLPRVCLACGTANSTESQHCRSCGRRLPPVAPATGVREPAPRAYTPGYLAERILTSRSAIEGERKQVTVLFADVKGSMEMLADRDPEEARGLLDPVLETMMDAVHRYEGTVNQVLGDGIMALFGAPLAHEDHAVRACYAALAMQAAMRRRMDEIRRDRGIEVQVRVGLNSGDVVVRSIGNDLHMDYTAVGQTTHLAARMEQLAPPGSILLSADTLRLAEGLVRVRPLGPVDVKGLPEQVVAFELLGVTSRTRWQTRAARGLTRFVGRQRELYALAGAFVKAQAGQGQVVAVVGEPGVGKSRLVWEFVHSNCGDGWLVLESGAVPYGRATPYLPVLDLLRAYFHIGVGDGADAIREKVADRIGALNGALRSSRSPLHELLEVAVDDAAWQALDPPRRRRRIIEAVRDLLLAESGVQPVLVVVEDLQWIDAETQVLLDRLVESLGASRLVLVVTYRLEYRHQWAGTANYVELPISPLPARNAEELLEALLGRDGSLAPVKRLLIERTEGNPLFLEESVRTLLETEALVGERGTYRLAKPVTKIQVPATVHAVLAARLDRLSAEQKRLLQTAAVIGKDFGLGLLRAIADETDEDLRQHLAQLQAAEFLDEAHLFPEPEYAFKHALTHEVAYSSLLHDRRRALHARIMETIETLYPDRLLEHVDLLAHHAFLGEVWDKALIYLRQAGAKAVARSAHSEAVACFERALQTLEHVPPGREAAEQAITLRLHLANSLVPIGELALIPDHLREAERLALELGDRARLGRVSSFLTQYFWLMGDPQRAVARGQQALAIAETLGDLALQVRTNLFLGQAYHILGDYSRAIAVLGLNVESLQGDLLGRRFGMVGLPSVLSRTWLVWSLAERGEFATALPRAEEGVQIAEAAGHPFSLLAAFFGQGGLYLRKSDLPRAVLVLERALALCQVWDYQLRLWFLGIAPSLGHAYALSGRVDEAIPLLEQAVEQASSMKVMFSHSLRIAWLADAYLRAGRIEEAAALVPQARELARRHGERGYETWILCLMGEMATAATPPDPEQAEAAYRQAIGVAEELGMRPRLACSRLGLGRLLLRVGEHRKAAEHLGRAVAEFREMGMPFWLEEAEAALRKAT